MTQPCGRSDRSFPPRPSATVHGVRSGRLRYSIAITARATTRTQACSRPRCFGRCFATCAPTWIHSFIRYLRLFVPASHQFVSPAGAARLNDHQNCAFLAVEGGSRQVRILSTLRPLFLKKDERNEKNRKPQAPPPP